jgi:hypothetical protein
MSRTVGCFRRARPRKRGRKPALSVCIHVFRDGDATCLVGPKRVIPTSAARQLAASARARHLRMAMSIRHRDTIDPRVRASRRTSRRICCFRGEAEESWPKARSLGVYQRSRDGDAPCLIGPKQSSRHLPRLSLRRLPVRGTRGWQCRSATGTPSIHVFDEGKKGRDRVSVAQALERSGESIALPKNRDEQQPDAKRCRDRWIGDVDPLPGHQRSARATEGKRTRSCVRCSGSGEIRRVDRSPKKRR